MTFSDMKLLRIAQVRQEDFKKKLGQLVDQNNLKINPFNKILNSVNPLRTEGKIELQSLRV